MQRILLYNAGCSFCTNVARGVEEEAGGWLSARDLYEPEMRALLERAPGRPPGEEPVLLLVEQGRVTVLRGLAMRLRLLAGLGPRRAWGVLARIASAAGEQAPARSTGVSRRGVLGRTAAVVAAAGVFSGMRMAPAAAAPSAPDPDDWLARLDLTDPREIPQEQIKGAWQRARNSSNVRKLLEAELPDSPAELEDLRADTEAEELGGVVHQIADGGELTALVWRRGDVYCFSYEARRPGGVLRRAQILRLDQERESAHVLATADTDALTLPSGEVSTLASCTSDSDCSGACYACRCTSLNVSCAANCCGPCAFACGAVWSCLSCLGVWCPACQLLNSCCQGKDCRWRESCS